MRIQFDEEGRLQRPPIPYLRQSMAMLVFLRIQYIRSCSMSLLLRALQLKPRHDGRLSTLNSRPRPHGYREWNECVMRVYTCSITV